jgi:hypothetical protein
MLYLQFLDEAHMFHIQLHNDPMQLLFDKSLRDVFVELDFSLVRLRFIEPEFPPTVDLGVPEPLVSNVADVDICELPKICEVPNIPNISGGANDMNITPDVVVNNNSNAVTNVMDVEVWPGVEFLGCSLKHGRSNSGLR